MPHLTDLILNRYDNICYRICFLLFSWGGFLVPVRECVFPLWENMCFLLFLALQTIHALGCLLGIQDGFGFFFLFVSSIIWSLIMTASSFSAVPSASAICLSCLTCFVLFLRSSSKFLCCLTSPMTMSRPPWTGSCRWVLSSSDRTSPWELQGNFKLSGEERSLLQFPLPPGWKVVLLMEPDFLLDSVVLNGSTWAI